ncbi:hypothetical protein [Paeniglutamicibacter psychrophenolicus]|uniref:hypothetical protein n=1 Tax=Paeniglutamicibacter psychrophenolicus TaxID=257454 RepID=UPI0027D8BDAC|nr:hypothetical protein [Paeniglutamicibacter psychrophenolicus]
MKHWAINLIVAFNMASDLPGCSSVVEDLGLATTQPSSRPALLSPDATPAMVPERPDDPHGIEQRLASGEHPIEQAVPGSEQVLLSVERSRGFTFALPARTKDVKLWIAVRCRRPVPLSLRTFDASGRNTTVYSLGQCPATDLVAGPLDTTETSGVLAFPDGVRMHFTLVAGDSAIPNDSPGTRWPRKFLR